LQAPRVTGLFSSVGNPDCVKRLRERVVRTKDKQKFECKELVFIRICISNFLKRDISRKMYKVTNVKKFLLICCGGRSICSFNFIILPLP
jgi:hypothetical protein